jgi:hypothetical protein
MISIASSARSFMLAASVAESSIAPQSKYTVRFKQANVAAHVA